MAHQAEKANFPVSFMCKILGVSRSGYHAWLKREPSKRAKANEELSVKIVEIFNSSRGTYGSPRVTEELEAQGFEVDRKRVARLMAKIGLSADLKPKFRAVDSEPAAEIAGNVLDRQFEVDEPDRVWVSDITYIWTVAGWLYLAVVIDLYSRRVVGWAMADHMRAELVLEALDVALGSRKPSDDGLLFHSDQGAQYKAKRVRETLLAEGITCSMSRRGNCWDNGGVTFIQRADSSLRLNVHFHCLVLDGVYVRDAEGGLRFQGLGKASAEEVVEVARWTYEALTRVMARDGRSLEDCDAGVDDLALEQPVLASCYGASLSDRQLLGTAPGERTRKLVHPVRELISADEGLAEVGGVNVHVGAAVGARDHRRLERLCGYVARPLDA